MKYVYPAIFTDEGNGLYSVNFPDFENIKNHACFTSGEGIANALEMANDVLCMTLYDIEKENLPLPKVSSIKDIKCAKNEFAQYVNCDTDFYKRFFDKKVVKKNLTIPSNLAALAERENINFSAVLQEALKQKIKIAHR
jgi:predicted RNase H-like HicB family nuclease